MKYLRKIFSLMVSLLLVLIIAVPGTFASGFTLDDYIQAVLYNKPLPSSYPEPYTPPVTQPSPSAQPDQNQNPPQTQPPTPAPEAGGTIGNYSLYYQPIRTPDDYKNAVLNKPANTVYYNNPAPVTQPQEPSEAPQAPPPSQPPQPLPQAPAELTSSEAKLFELINSARTGEGVKPVVIDLKLVEIARLKARDMIENNYFGHISPTYGSPGQMLRSFGVSFTSAGENLAKSGDVYKAHILLLNSTKGHREILLDPDYSKVGVAVVPQGSYVIVVELFVQP